MLQVFQTVFAALLITFSAWLSERYPDYAGLLIAMPLSSMLVLPFAYWQHGDGQASVLFAQEILRAIPLSVLFFVPFALAGRFGLSFWQAYVSGIGALVGGYLILRWFS